MERTQIYLQESQKRELEKLAEQKGTSVAQVIREAVNMYIASSKKTGTGKILETAGLWKDRSDMPDSVQYVDTMRKEMDSHMEDTDK